MTKAFILCADDYALAPGVSAAIRTLAAQRRLSATSVMTVFDDLQTEADRLMAVARRDFGIGLHLTLTGGFAPLAADPLGKGRFPSLGVLLAASFAGRLDEAALAREVDAQFAAFTAAFGRPPTHIDGHQHAHVLPQIRPLVLAAAQRHAPGALVRDCTQAPSARLGFDAKGRLISFLSRGVDAAAAHRGLRTNRGFAGAYDLARGGDFETLFRHFVRGIGNGGLIMVHPGHLDDVLASRDPVLAPRAAEFDLLSGPAFEDILSAADARLA